MRAPITQAQAWAVIAESAGWNAKELPVLPQGYGSIPWAYRGNVFIESQLKAYGAACAAQARESALSEAKLVAKTTCHHESTEFANGFNMAALNIESAIEALKGKR